MQQFAQILNLIHHPNTWIFVVFTVKRCNQIISNSSLHQTLTPPPPIFWAPNLFLFFGFLKEVLTLKKGVHLSLRHPYMSCCLSNQRIIVCVHMTCMNADASK